MEYLPKSSKVSKPSASLAALSKAVNSAFIVEHAVAVCFDDRDSTKSKDTSTCELAIYIDIYSICIGLSFQNNWIFCAHNSLYA